jgi:hypothetical protein
MDVEDATTSVVRHAVEIAGNAHHPLMRDPPFELENRSVGRDRQRFRAPAVLRLFDETNLVRCAALPEHQASCREEFMELVIRPRP